MMRLRLLSLDKWVPKPLHVPAYLFRSDEFLPDAPDFNWGSLCNQLQVIPVAGSHVTLFEPSSLEILCQRFLEAVQAAVAEASHAIEGGQHRVVAERSSEIQPKEATTA
jgi:thioesterase domain-containing protein